MVDTGELELDQEDQQKKKSPQIGKTIPGPPLSDEGSIPMTIGKPIQKEVPTGVDNPPPPTSTPSEMGQVAPPNTTISGGGPLAPLTPKPQYHGLNRVLDTIGGATTIGQAIERGGGLGTEGWRQTNADEQKQLEDAAKLRQEGATTEETQARGKLAESQSGQVIITDPITGHTITTNAKDAPGIWKEIIGQTGAGQRTAATQAGAGERTAATVAGREDVANTNQAEATARTTQTNQTRRDIAREKPAPQAEQAITDHLASQGLPDTPENRDQARLDMSNEKTAGGLEAKNTAAIGELGKSAQQAYKRLQALSKEDSDPSNYAFLMSFIGMSYQAIKGARLNQAEIVRAAATRTLPDQLQHAYDLYVKNRLLTPEQKQDMLKTAQIIADSYNEPKTTQGEVSSKPSASGATSQSGPAKFGDWVKKQVVH